MKNHELIANVGGIEKAREIVAGAKDFWFAYDTIDGEYMSGGDIQDGYSISDYEGCILIYDLRTVIAEHDAPKFKVGDSIVAIDESIKKVFVILAIEYDTLYKVAEASFFVIGSFRHATPSEIAAGHRIDQSNTDDIADIKYHISPLTVVTELHVSEALRLNELG